MNFATDVVRLSNALSAISLYIVRVSNAPIAT